MYDNEIFCEVCEKWMNEGAYLSDLCYHIENGYGYVCTEPLDNPPGKRERLVFKADEGLYMEEKFLDGVFTSGGWFDDLHETLEFVKSYAPPNQWRNVGLDFERVIIG